MSIFSPIPRSELGTRYTHYGWFCLVVPIYISELEGEAPQIVERNGVPEWVLHFAFCLFDAYIRLAYQVTDNADVEYPLLVTGPIPSPAGSRDGGHHSAIGFDPPCPEWDDLPASVRTISTTSIRWRTAF